MVSHRRTDGRTDGQTAAHTATERSRPARSVRTSVLGDGVAAAAAAASTSCCGVVRRRVVLHGWFTAAGRKKAWKKGDFASKYTVRIITEIIPDNTAWGLPVLGILRIILY